MICAGAAAGCGSQQPHSGASASSFETLRIGFGLTTGIGAEAGMKQAAQFFSSEGLVNVPPSGRPIPWIAESWSKSDDGLTWRLTLRRGVTFHNGQPVTAGVVAELLTKQLPASLGAAYDDVASVEAATDQELVFHLKERSSFLLDGLNVPVLDPVSGAGTGPFLPAQAQDAGTIELRSNEHYYGPRPLIDRIVLRSYPSLRSAWAEMLRGNLDMLYEVGVDAVDLMQPSVGTNIFTSPRPYGYVIVLNVRKPQLRDKAVRQALNAAIDRQEFVQEGLRGHGRVATGFVSPDHWAAKDASVPYLSYAPRAIADPARPLKLTLLLTDPSHERLGLIVQQQLRKVGVEVTLEFVPLDPAYARVQAGDFDAWLADLIQGPTLLRPYLFWHSDSIYNWAGYSSRAVDAALETVRHAADDDAYKAGVDRFQRAIVDDPPAIFLAWSERARAVSTRFDIPAEPGRDILSMLPLWRPVGAARYATGQ